MRLLFICSGNICRSAMAAEYFRQRAAQRGLSHVAVDSGGTLGIQGAPASREAIVALGEIGIDLTAHRSKGLEEATLRSTDLVIAMTRDHLDELAHRFPDGAERRLLLRAFEKGSEPDSDARDLEDPIGKPLEFYREQLKLIVRCLDNLALNLQSAQ